MSHYKARLDTPIEVCVLMVMFLDTGRLAEGGGDCSPCSCSSVKTACTLMGSDSESEPGEAFGQRVAISGDTVLVGASGHDHGGLDRGAVYVFDRATTTWCEVTEWLGIADSDFFSEPGIDGDIAVVGATLADDGAIDSGAAYVFERTNGTWSYVKQLVRTDIVAGDGFGGEPAIDGDNIAIGAPQASVFPFQPGKAYVFNRNHGGANNWGQVPMLPFGADGTNRDGFGGDVAIEGNVIVVGAPNHDTDTIGDSGAAFVFELKNGVWAQAAKLKACSPHFEVGFGGSVAISKDMILVGAQRDDAAGENSGAVYVFTRPPTGWVDACSSVFLRPDDIAANEEFGHRLRMSGNLAVVGSLLHDSAGPDAGAAYVFERQPSGWKQIRKLISPQPYPAEQFGAHVSISGTQVVIGTNTPQNVGGAAYVFEFNPQNCLADVDCNGVVNVDDLLAVISAWGSCGTLPCSTNCWADITLDCSVAVDDLLAVINNWGPCDSD